MKKLFLVLAAATFCFAAVSCKKDCVCTTTSTEELIQDVSVTYPDKLSTSDCEAMSSSITAAGITTETVCKSE